jgi:ATP-dependent Clp protease protease subunit
MPDSIEFKKYAKDKGIGGRNIDNYIASVNNMTRSVIEERHTPFREIDVFSRLIMDRIIFLGTKIDDNISNIVIAQMLFLESVNPDKDIKLYINTPGGNVYPGLGIYDTMQYIKPDVSTICIGLAASMGAILLSGGAKGKRYALPHSRIMIHQPLGGMEGQTSDMEITVNQMLEIKKDLYNILAKHTGKNYNKIDRDADRDYWMNSADALTYGLIDEVLVR